jgi:hypothetical protein
MSEPPTLLVARTEPAYNNPECTSPDQNPHSSAQYDAKCTSPDQNPHSSAQYDAKRTSPDQNPHSSAQYSAKRSSPEQACMVARMRGVPGAKQHNGLRFFRAARS